MANKKGAWLGKQCDQKLSKICQQAYQNQVNLQTFYRINKLKFPPLLRSKNLIFNAPEKPKAEASIVLIDNFQNNQEKSEKPNAVQEQTSSRPKICPIIFKRIKAKKGSLISNGDRSIFNGSRTIEIDKDIALEKFKTVEKKQLKFINQASKNNLSTILNSFYTNRSKQINSQRKMHQELKNSGNWRNLLNQSILVNNAMTPNPQNLFLQSINRSRSNLLNVERELIVKKQAKFDLKRISIYKNADGLFSNRKNKIDSTKDVSNFQPWQMTKPEDQLAQCGISEIGI